MALDNNKEIPIIGLPVIAFNTLGYVLLTGPDGKTGAVLGQQLVDAIIAAGGVNLNFNNTVGF